MIAFGSKAETLEKLENVIRKAKVLPQIRLNACDWNQHALITKIEQKGWKNIPLIVRSSASQEDTLESSLAGHFVSLTNIQNLDELCEAVDHVIASYGKLSTHDQVFIQPMLQSVCMSGVAFSYDPRTGAPYRVINYDDMSGSINSVTAGKTNALKVYYAHHTQINNHPEPISQIIELLEELESHFGEVCLDIEFAITEKRELFLFQVRPRMAKTAAISVNEHTHVLRSIESKIKELSKPHPYLHGSKGIFGIMPDWNPAEITGVRPRPLALSLYKDIITDNIWAYQRENYGYRNLRSFPLLIHFHGLPYIDVRVSFNSFIPSVLNDQLAEKLVNYYLVKLEKEPHLHDKIEFEIIYSCYTLDLPQRLNELKEAGFSSTELDHLSSCLRLLTNRIIDPENGLCSRDLQKIKNLEDRFVKICSSSLNTISKIYWLLEDCKRYGTLPFAGIARAAFIAVQLLKSLVHIGILTPEETDAFLASLNTMCSNMQKDRWQLHKNDFLARYGHLRAGTYDILSPRYDEAPDYYFDWDNESAPIKNSSQFVLRATQRKQIENILHEHGLQHDVASLFEFIESAIEGREHAKFLFSRSLSEALRLIKQLGDEYGLTQEECSYLDISDIKRLYSCSLDIKSLFMESLARGKKLHACAKEVILPPLIRDFKEVWSFNLTQTEPNYVTLKKASGSVCLLESSEANISGKIVMISSADPGYDWIFIHPIAGFITMFGGVNSHMAIRSAELGIPAVIGAGELLYHRWSQAKILEMDCENKIVKVIQ